MARTNLPGKVGTLSMPHRDVALSPCVLRPDETQIKVTGYISATTSQPLASKNLPALQ